MDAVAPRPAGDRVARHGHTGVVERSAEADGVSGSRDGAVADDHLVAGIQCLDEVDAAAAGGICHEYVFNRDRADAAEPEAIIAGAGVVAVDAVADGDVSDLIDGIAVAVADIDGCIQKVDEQRIAAGGAGDDDVRVGLDAVADIPLAKHADVQRGERHIQDLHACQIRCRDAVQQHADLTRLAGTAQQQVLHRRAAGRYGDRRPGTPDDGCRPGAGYDDRLIDDEGVESAAADIDLRPVGGDVDAVADGVPRSDVDGRCLAGQRLARA